MSAGTPAIRLDDRFFGDELSNSASQIMPRAEAALQDLIAKRCKGAEFTGWFDYPHLKGEALVRDVRKMQSQLEVHYDLVVVIGIGGSYLGTRAISEALSHEYAAMMPRPVGAKRSPIVYAGHHLAEAGLLELLDLMETRQPIINVISKTGTTTEPSVAFRILRGYMERRFGKKESSRRIIATTDPAKGALRKLATDSGFASFEVPDDVGGRFSVLTAVGLVPLALAGFAIEDLLDGADSVFKDLKSAPFAGNALQVLKYASSRLAAWNCGKTVEVLNYSDPKLRSFIEWWKQLYGESEGKDGKGVLPMGFASTTDLHSLGQYVQDGVRNLFETFLVFERERSIDALGVERRLRLPHTSSNTDELGYLEDRFISDVNMAASQGSKIAHFEGGVPCMELKLATLNERNLGALIAFYETACAVSGAMLGVNPFDQPGVEAYKKNLFGLLGKPGFEQLGADLRRRL